MHRIILLIFILIVNIAMGQNMSEIPLYKNSVPNSKASNFSERFIVVNGTRRIYNVTNPTLAMYAPKTSNGTAIIICPGGGYGRLSIDHEGVLVAKQLNTLRITAFVLKYRLPNDTIMVDRSIGPLQDIQQAIRLVKQGAFPIKGKLNKIGVMGFSAGGHVAATAVTHYKFIADNSVTDTVSLRPDFAILIYPVISFNDSITHKGSRNNLIGEKGISEKVNFFSNELQVTKDCPPVFIVHAGDDKSVPVENSIRFYQACIKNNVPVEMHLYPNGGHGFGLDNKTTKDKWMERLENWLKGLN